MSQLDDNIKALQDSVAAETTIDQSILTFIQGVPALIQAAVDKALAAGATATQLQALTDLKTTIDKNASDLAAAVTANTSTP